MKVRGRQEGQDSMKNDLAEIKSWCKIPARTQWKNYLSRWAVFDEKTGTRNGCRV